ncbi:MAG: Fe-S cluster assembly protein SufD [Candidatus Dormibacteria bacterium]
MSLTLTETHTRQHGFTEESVRRLSADLGEPEWALQQRLAAIQLFEALDWPPHSAEFWKRTEVEAFDLSRFDARGPGGVTLLESAAPKDVIALPLDVAIREHPSLVQAHLGSVLSMARSKWVALHFAFRRGGFFIHVPSGVQVAEALVLSTRVDGDGACAFGHLLCVAEANGRIDVIEDRTSQGGPQLVVDAVEVIANDGAQVGYNLVHEWGPGTIAQGFQVSRAGRNATVSSVNVAVGGASAVTHIESSLEGEGASAKMAGVLVGAGEQHFDQQTLQEHVAPHCTSDLLFKSVLTGSADATYAGLIRVHPDAQKTDAYQANRNLLLSSTARAESVPKLEIEANDVRCTHGATVGPVDQEQLFYLMARGLRRPDAERLIVDGFLAPVLDRIPLAQVRDRVHDVLDRKLLETAVAEPVAS